MFAQKTNATLQSEVNALKKETVNLKLQLKSHNNSDSASTDNIKRSITRWAKFFQLFYFPVLIVDSFTTAKPGFAPDDPKRYEGDNTTLGLTAELYAVIPQKYMTYMRQFDNLAKHVSEYHYYQLYMTSDHPQFHE